MDKTPDSDIAERDKVESGEGIPRVMPRAGTPAISGSAEPGLMRFLFSLWEKASVVRAFLAFFFNKTVLAGLIGGLIGALAVYTTMVYGIGETMGGAKTVVATAVQNSKTISDLESKTGVLVGSEEAQNGRIDELTEFKDRVLRLLPALERLHETVLDAGFGQFGTRDMASGEIQPGDTTGSAKPRAGGEDP